MRFFVDDDAAHLGRHQGVDHELRRILGPKNDIHALARELLRDGLNAGSAHADTRPDRVDALIVGLHRDLRARSGIAGRRLDLEEPFFDLRDLEFEQLDEELRRDAGQDELGSARAAIDLEQVSPDPIADPQVLLGNHLFTRQNRFEATGFDDGVAAFHALDGAGDQVFLAIKEVVEDLLPLGIANLLQNHLFGGLRADPAEFDRFERLFDEITELQVRLIILHLFDQHMDAGIGELLLGHQQPAPEGGIVARLTVDLDAHVGLFLEALLGCGGERDFERAEHRVLVDVLFPGQRVHQ